MPRGALLGNTLPFQWQANEDEGKFEEVLRKFDENCLPRTNETYEAYKCFSRSQHAGETVEAYITALYKLSSTCNYGTMTERLIKDRLFIGIRDDKAREKLLAKEQLDLETCINTLKMLQITHTYAQEINTDVTTHTVKNKSARAKQVNNEQSQKSPKIDHCVQAAGDRTQWGIAQLMAPPVGIVGE